MRVLRGAAFFFVLFSHMLRAGDLINHQVASLNLWGWGPNPSSRIKRTKEFLIDQKNIGEAKVLFAQEALKKTFSFTASDLAAEMGWDFYFVKRQGDAEGLAILYHPSLKVLSKDYLHIQAKHDENDYARIALSVLVEDSKLGKIRYVNTHLAHEPFMSDARKGQLNEILEWIKSLDEVQKADWVIFGGDFNTGPTETYYADEFKLLEDSIFAFEHSPSEGAAYSWSNLGSGAGLKTELVDHFHIGVGRASPWALSTYKTLVNTQSIEEGLSDHALLRLDIEFTKE